MSRCFSSLVLWDMLFLMSTILQLILQILAHFQPSWKPVIMTHLHWGICLLSIYISFTVCKSVVLCFPQVYWEWSLAFSGSTMRRHTPWGWRMGLTSLVLLVSTTVSSANQYHKYILIYSCIQEWIVLCLLLIKSWLYSKNDTNTKILFLPAR